MDKIVECVPNFSEGRNKAVIDAIADAIRQTEGVMLLDVDPGAATNRTVMTFVGEPDAVVEAAFQAIKKAAELIDMRKHKGEHPRIGATDVCPFVPVSGVTMQDCVELAHRLGKRVGEELGIPVYLYEEAATRPERRNLADIRKGEYEGLADKLKDPDWAPDYGPAEFNPKSGATVIGAREFLIAYNVNLNTRDRRLAQEIALNIREMGRAKRDDQGKIIRDEEGNIVRVPGKLKAVKAVGWYIDEYACAQVSMNLVNWKVTPPHVAFDEICKEADKLGLRVTGSELVGLIPLQPMLEAGRYFLKKQGKSPGVPEAELIRVAVQSMGMSEFAPFDPGQKIIEYRIREPRGKLASLPVGDFADSVSMENPTPGGGSVAALAGALAAALTAMVANLTVGKKDYEAVWEQMQELAVQAQEKKDALLRAIDRDAQAFDEVMAAFGLPRRTDEQKAAREAAIEEATRKAASVPFEVLQTAVSVLELARSAAELGNVNAASDAGTAAAAALAAAKGAYLNVRINTKELKDRDWAEERDREAASLLERAEALAYEVTATVLRRIST